MGWPRRRMLLAAGAVAVVVAGGVLVAVIASRGGDPPAEPTVAIVYTGANPAERANVAAVTRLLTGLPAAFAAGRKDGLTAAAGARFADVRRALPPGSTVRVHPDTWRRSGAIGSMGVTVATPGAATQSFVVLLSREPTGWKVSGTQAAPGPG